MDIQLHGIGGGGAGAGGGDWGTGAGGYTSSCGDNETMTYGPCVNGVAYSWEATIAKTNPGRRIYDNSGNTISGGIGACYYTEGRAATSNARGTIIPEVGGQGGIDYGWFVGGSGGVGGRGGKITVSNTSTVYAFNGDRITNKDYTDINANYDASGVLSNAKGEFIQAKCYAQSGILREVYCITAKWGEKPNHNYAYFKSLFGDDCAISGDFSNPTAHDENYKNVCVRNEIKDKTIDISSEREIKTTYINSITNNCQGVGSGFGYIELSNGSYEVDANLN